MQSIKSENAKIPMKELCAVRMDFLPKTAISTKILPKLPISSDVVGYPKTRNLRGEKPDCTISVIRCFSYFL